MFKSYNNKLYNFLVPVAVGTTAVLAGNQVLESNSGKALKEHTKNYECYKGGVGYGLKSNGEQMLVAQHTQCYKRKSNKDD